MRNWILGALFIVGTGTVNAADYGLGHGVVTYGANKVIGRINDFLFYDKDFAKGLTNFETGVAAVYYCAREAKARGTWNISEWSSDSIGDCITPAAVAGGLMYRSSASGKPLLTLWRIEW